VPPANNGIYDHLRSTYYDRLKSAKQTEGKQARRRRVEGSEDAALAEIIPTESRGREGSERLLTAWHDLEQRVVRDLILSGSVRRSQQ